MGKLNLKGATELLKLSGAHYLVVLRQRDYKTKPTEFEILYRHKKLDRSYRTYAKVKPHVALERMKELTNKVSNQLEANLK